MPTQRKRYTRQKVSKRILAIHAAIADKIIAEPSLIVLAEKTLATRYQQKQIRYGSYIVWQSLLPLIHDNPELFKAELLAADPKMEQLRRETIFVGILSEEERSAILRNSENPESRA